MTQQIETIRQACIKANPSILDLVFGCEFCRFSDKGIVDVLASLQAHMDGGFTVAMQRKGTIGFNHYSTTRDDVESWVILGRPIRLTDVLLATEKRWRTMYGVNPIDGLKRDIPLREGEMLYYICSKWNLLKDDLREQSPETIEFIYNLLN